jgi:tetratricopeptide (TPR) repeat protein
MKYTKIKWGQFVIVLIFTSFFGSVVARAESGVEGNFIKANAFYQRGEFKKACDVYQKINDKDASVYYNMGNCAFQLGKLGYALLYWRRAEKMWGVFGKKKLLDNITLLKKHAESLSGGKPKRTIGAFRFFKRARASFISFIGSAPLWVLQLLFLMLWLFLFIYVKYLFWARRKILISLLFCLIALLGVMLVVRYMLDVRHYGVVVSKQARLLSGPGNTFQKLSTLPEAEEVRITKQNHGFYKIRVGKRIGWVSSKEIEMV